MGGRIRRLRVHELERCSQSIVQHATNVHRVLLSVLVNGRDPVACRACHAGERRGVLSVIPRQPYCPHKWVLSAEKLDGLIRPVRTAVVNEQDFTDHEARPVWRRLLARQWRDLPDQGRERLLSAVYRDHQRNAMHGTLIHKS